MKNTWLASREQPGQVAPPTGQRGQKTKKWKLVPWNGYGSPGWISLAGSWLTLTFYYYYYFMHLRVLLACMSVPPRMCLLLIEARKGRRILHSWSSTGSWPTLWVFQIKPRHSGRAPSVLSRWAILQPWVSSPEKTNPNWLVMFNQEN